MNYECSRCGFIHPDETEELPDGWAEIEYTATTGMKWTEHLCPDCQNCQSKTVTE